MAPFYHFTKDCTLANTVIWGLLFAFLIAWAMGIAVNWWIDLIIAIQIGIIIGCSGTRFI